jgi:hypothetical protein
MKRTARIIFWTLLFFLLLLGVDQFLLRIPAKAPAHVEARGFYLDFRSRLLRMAETEPIPLPARSVSGSRGAEAATESAPRFLYVDGQGQLQFVDSIEEIPPAFRREAQPLDR